MDVIFGEKTIEENKVCYAKGKADLTFHLLNTMRQNKRTTIKLSEFEEVTNHYNIIYEKLWNKWADQNNIGGSRFNELGDGSCSKK